ncbi:MAG: protease modulator HflK [Ruminococcaceae bacterium]|nr:protease modulator HflK [Oscillospiraceae bacterium]
MNPKPRSRMSGARFVTLASLFCLLAAAALMVFLRYRTNYVPLLLLALILALPAAINLLLLVPLPREGQKEASAASSEKISELLTRRARVAAFFKKQVLRFARAVCHRRASLLAGGIVLLTVAINVFFWLTLKNITYAGRLNYFIAVLLAALFVLFIVFGKWCKHRMPECAENEPAVEQRYGAALLRNMQSAFALARLGVLLSAVTVMLALLGIYDFTKWLTVLFGILFAYQTAFTFISLFVVLVRRELEVAPEVSAPAPGVEGGDLGIVTYLEKNTGISMRSLWSIQMIKKAIPYAVLMSVLLLWGVTGVVMVESHQEGAHYRFGELREETLGPGLHLTLPWPFDTVEVYDTGTVNKMTVGYIAEGDADNIWTEAHGGEEYRLLLGGGNELVSVNLRVMYRIKDLRAYLTNCSSPELLMSAASYEIITARTITSDLDAMLATDRVAFASDFAAALTEVLTKYQTGLEVVNVVLESIHPPVEIADAYQAMISAEIEAGQMILDAEAYAGERLAWAWIDYDSTLAVANITKHESMAGARASVAEFMASVEADNAYSEEYRYYKYMQAITEAYSGAKLVIVGDGINEENIYIGNIGSSTNQYD